ncbi:hypothetical protein FZEAL_9379 [Fusarium zealandicum]|uniref:Uncharacterized protein n=1 Tax=Fusarium zealandicum TaxID=1053134 RepID=A0A8H4XG66_9HYPO|nr:hypothetical protein FZEAL_9379 [Fusarium zealandicum]
MAQHPYYGGNYPPPLFAAELDSQSVPSGGHVYEMCGDPAPAPLKTSKEKPSPTAQSPEQSGQAHPWPFYLENTESSKPTQDEGTDNSNKTDPPASSNSAMANPWAYFGPGPSDDAPAPAAVAPGHQYIDDRRPSEPMYKPYPGNSELTPSVPHGAWPSAGSTSPDPTTNDSAFYPAPLKLAYRPAKPVSPPAFKPYSPPASQDAQESQPKPLGYVGRTDSQSTTASVPYRPYRPHSPQPPTASAAPSANPPSASSSPAPLPAAGPQQQFAGAAPHHFYSLPATSPPPAADVNVSPRPATTAPTSPVPQLQPQPQPQVAIVGGAPVQPAPQATSPYLPSPMSPPQAHSASMTASSPATPSLNVGVPFTQAQYAAPVAAPNYSTGPMPTPSGVSAGPPPQTHLAPAVVASNPTYHPGQPSSATGAPTPAYNPGQPSPGHTNYNTPQPTYASMNVPPVSSSTGVNQPTAHPPAPYQHPAQTGPEPHRPYPQHSSTEPYPASGAIPQSPPPPYAQHIGPRPGSQPPAAGHPSPYQPPPPGGHYAPQPQYPTQQTYAPVAAPYLQGQSSFGLQPPPLPPRPSSAQGLAPTTGFGTGPTGYNPASFPPPPQTYFSPSLSSHQFIPQTMPPSLPPRPGVGKLFGSSSADKWLRKTGHVLESTLAPILQGQPGSYRPGGQYGQQGPRPYAPNFHAPHLAPQFRSVGDYERPLPGPNAPAPGGPGPN